MSIRSFSFARLLGLSALLMGLAIGCDGSTPPPTPPIETPRPDAERSTVEVSRAGDVVDDGDDASTVTVTVRRAGGEPMGGMRVLLEVAGEGARLTPSEGLTDASGVLKSALTATSPGAKTLKVSAMAAGGAVVLSTRPVVDFRAAAAAKLVFLTSPQAATAGAPLAPAVEVAIQDAKGRTVTSATHEVTLALGAHPRGAVLEGTLTARAVKGVARFPEVVLKQAGTGYTLVASAAGLASATSAAFNVGPAAAASLSLALSTQEVTAGGSLEATVTLADGFGNVATNYTGTVVLTRAGETAVEHTFTAADAGKHTFPGLVFQRAGLVALTAAEKAASPALTATKNVNVLPGPVAKLAFSQQPASQSVRAPLATVQVALTDAFDNRVAVNAPAVTVALVGGTGASLGGVKTVAPADGVASFTHLSVDTEGAGYTLTASAEGLTGATSSAFTIRDDVAPAVAVLQQDATARTSITVGWDAVGDDGMLGTAVAYELRYSPSHIVTDEDFARATQVTTAGPRAPGVREQALLAGLAVNTTYYVALKVTDNAGNASRSANLQVSTPDPKVAKLVFTQQPVDGVAGEALADIIVELQDADGFAVASATSAVTLTLKADPSLTRTVGAVGGVATFSGVRIDKADTNYAFEASSGALPTVTSGPFTIRPAAAKELVMVGLMAPVTSEVESSMQVTVKDAFGNVATGYRGTVHFTSSDAAAVLPADHAFSEGDAGRKSFPVTLLSAGRHSVTVTDAAAGTLTASLWVDVGSGKAERLVMTGLPSTLVAGSAQSFVVTARDHFGNIVTGYEGTVALASTLAGSNLAAEYTFTAGDKGQKTFDVTFTLVGNASVTVTDKADAALQASGSTTVEPGEATALVLSALASGTAGEAFSVTLTAEDAFGNQAKGYRGTVHFEVGGDADATLPADHLFTAGDAGRRVFEGVVLTRAGLRLLAVADTASATLAASAGVTVNAASARKLAFMGQPQSGRVRAPLAEVRVALTDVFGNPTRTSSPAVVLGLASETASGTLGGTTTQTPVDGVATFANLTVDDEGRYTLNATAEGLVTATSAAFDLLDDVAPGQPMLAAADITKNSIAVEWNAVGDDGQQGRAAAYELRYSTSRIDTDEDFAKALQATTGMPQTPGTREQVRLTGLSVATTYYVALKVTDGAGNSSRSATLQVSTKDPQAVQLAITRQPVGGIAGEALADILVELRDVDGDVVASSTAAVTLTLNAHDTSFTVNAQGGVATFSGLRINRAGVNYTFAATSSVLPTVASDAFTLVHANVSRLVVTQERADAQATAGISENFTVTATDDFGNVATSYTGTVHFAATDTRAQLPADFTFTPGDQGSKQFSVTFKGAGTQEVHVQDVGNAALARLFRYEVSPAAAAGFVLNGPSSATAGQGFQLTLSVLDAFGNAATGYRGIVRFTTTSALHVLPADYTFTADDRGQKTFFGPELRSAGDQEVQVQDSVDAALVAMRAVTVSPSTATKLVLAGGAGPYDAGTSFSLEVVARDAFDNVATGYLGRIHFSSTDLKATLPADYTFIAGEKGRHLFTGVVLNTGGTQAIQAVDTVANTVAGSFEVRVLAPTSLGLTVAAGPHTSEQTFSVEVSALTDALSSAPNYTGTVRFSSSDPLATLPEDYTFTADDKGRRGFDVTFVEAGLMTLTVTDVADASLTRTVNIQVEPGQPAQLVFTSEPANGTVRASLGTVRVAVLDAAGNWTKVTSSQVQLTLKGGSASATLGGTTGSTPVGGEASFTTLSVDEEGTGYQLIAAFTGLPLLDSVPFNVVDTVAPSPAVLRATATSVTSVTLGWSATGDDGTQGSAAAYELRFSTSAITTDAQFAAATLVSTGAPKAPGSAEALEVTGLDAATTYHFALKVRDGAGNQSTLATVSAATVNPCEGVTCAPSTTPPTCAEDGLSRVTSATACVVENNAASCVEQVTTTPCTGANAVCFAATCDTATKPLAGELVISEVMHSPSTGTTEYIELTNPTQKLLNLNGLEVSFTEGPVSRRFTVELGSGKALVIGRGGGTRVLAQVKDEAVNGGVKADYGYGPGFDLGSMGQLSLVTSTVIESLTYDFTFPQTPGRAMNLSSAIGGNGGNQRAWYWCDATAQLGGGDYGSPNLPNGACGMTVTAPLNYCRIQFPKTIPSVNVGETTIMYSAFWEPSVTDRRPNSNDFYPHLLAEFGVGRDPANPGTWTWKPAIFNPTYSNEWNQNSMDEDEVQANLTFTASGNYLYGFRYRMVDPFTGLVSENVYCDQNGVAADFTAALWGTVSATTTHVVISEISGRGVSLDNDEFIELYNPTSQPVDLSGWKVQYKSATGTAYNNSVTIPTGKIIPARGYFLLANASYTGESTVPRDVTHTLNISASNGAVRLGLPGIGIALDDPNTVDKVAYGTSTSPEGGKAAPAHPAAGGSLERKAQDISTPATLAVGGTEEFSGNGYDSDNNGADIVTRTVRQPQNSSSTIEFP